MSVGPVAPRVRSEVLTRADALAVVPLALVVAPAGSGKTTLLTAWRRRLAEAGEIAGYLDLSPLHGDASVLASDLLEVARRARPEFGEETSSARAEHAAASERWRAIARGWLRDAAALEAPLVLFLDNFHELPAGSEGARWLDELLRARHPKLVFVVSSRGSVPASAARLRTEGALIEVNAADLSLRTNEVQQLLADYGAGDDQSLAARVLARTEGWATGVQLAARRLARIDPEGREAFLQQLGREPDLFGFIAAEVLRDEPPELFAVIEAAAALGRCSQSDVVELLGDPGTTSAVVRAVDRGVLLSDGEEVWIHQLWREFISERITKRRTPEARHALLRSAGAILWRRRHWESALGCFAEIEDWESVGRVLLETAGAWTREGRAERIQHWIDRMPVALVDRTPALLAMRGLSTLRPTPQHALPDLERAMEMYRARGDRAQERAIAGMVGVVYLAQLRRDDALRVLRRLITLRGVLTDPRERGSLYVALAQRRYLTGRYRGAFAMAQRAAAMPLDPIAEWFNTILLAWIHTARGDWEVARRELDRVLARPEIVTHPFLHNVGRLMRARLSAIRGDIAGALEDAERAEEAFGDHRMPFVRELAGVFIAYARSRAGDRAAARRWYDEVLHRTSERGGGADAPTRVQFALDQFGWGEEAEAAREARRSLDAIDAAGDRWTLLMPWLEPHALWVLARAGDAREAQQRALARRRAFAMPDLPFAHFTVQLALADVAERAGEPATAQRHARTAFEFGAREGVRAVDPMIGAFATPRWAEWALREDVAADYALDRLAATCPERVAPLLAELASDASAALRERAVRLLAQRGGRSAWEPLRRASEDRVARVRDAARVALDHLDLRPLFSLGIRSLGGFAVLRGEDPVRAEDWKGQTARRLLARLLAAEGRALPREQLREDLWPGAESEAGRNNLRVAVTRLNDALDPERPSGAAPHFVVSEGELLRLRMDAVAEWDVARFRALLREADEAERRNDVAREFAAAGEALALYAGPLLPEIDDAWVLPLRRELADRFAATAQRIGPRLVLRGRLDDAAALAERMLRADPADEHGFALRMRVQLARRDRAGALRSYEDAVTVLRRELDLEPGGELRQLAGQARSAG